MDKIVESSRFSEAMSRQMHIKVKDIFSCLEGIDKGIVVDLGCFNNQLNTILANNLRDERPELDYVGVDCNLNLLKRRQDGQVICADALNLPFGKETISAFVLSSSMHEIVNDSSTLEFLKSLREMLKPGGRIVIRDLVKPDKPNLMFTLNIKDPDEEKTFLLFTEGYAPLKTDISYRYDPKTRKANMPAYLVYEYLRHRMFMEDGIDHFTHELKETYGRTSLEEMKTLADQANLIVLEAKPANSPMTVERMEKYKGRVDIKDAQGEDLNISVRMPTHMLVSLAK